MTNCTTTHRLLTTPARFAFALFILVGFFTCTTQLSVAQQPKSASGFQGDWNWAVYAKDKSELPPAYQSLTIEEVPAYALDLTLKRKSNRLTGEFGVLARYLARVDEGSFTTTIHGNSVRFRVSSNFGGSATVSLTLRGDTLKWKVLRSSGVNYFPAEVELRRLKPGEKLPYASDEPQ